MPVKKMQKRLFGTNGVRGVVGKDLTPELVMVIGQSLGSMRKGRIAVGRDTRTSGEMFIRALKAGLLSVGCDVVDCGVLPTPALQYIIKEEFAAGAMITASHNPPEYNGVKIIEPDGTEMGDEETVKLEEKIFSRAFTVEPWDRTGKETQGYELLTTYITATTRAFPEKLGNGMTVVVDPGSGPACLTTPRILTDLGCRVLTINAIMDGTFPGRLPEPSVEGLKNCAALVTGSGAAFGVAHDGDADRAVFIDEKGRFVEENLQFALIARHICRQKKGIVVTPVSTGQVAEDVIKKEQSSVEYTPVGSIYVARTMRSLIDQGKPVIFGGEGNGGLIFPEHQFCRDGGMTAAMMVSILASTGKKLSELVDELPPRTIIKEKIVTQKGAEIIANLKSAYSSLKPDETDGVKIFRNESWALIRASGTEPIIRVIIDSPSPEDGQAFHTEIMNKIRTVVNYGGP
ncbi:phosphoglucosamine mutase [Methanoregula sp.]|uniref:phosphoglucosamine mutase n=1 Tax=Methanoregula sp. TaxID=2052170 RepID=UPI00260BC5CD|nr:phosphoglucosamine mutase [Methanoregula sp.]MDD5143557.1 phosphoglucosamine mutase [Methanoregula sp.]